MLSDDSFPLGRDGNADVGCKQHDQFIDQPCISQHIDVTIWDDKACGGVDFTNVLAKSWCNDLFCIRSNCAANFQLNAWARNFWFIKFSGIGMFPDMHIITIAFKIIDPRTASCKFVCHGFDNNINQHFIPSACKICSWEFDTTKPLIVKTGRIGNNCEWRHYNINEMNVLCGRRRCSCNSSNRALL